MEAPHGGPASHVERDVLLSRLIFPFRILQDFGSNPEIWRPGRKAHYSGELFVDLVAYWRKCVEVESKGPIEVRHVDGGVVDRHLGEGIRDGLS